MTDILEQGTGTAGDDHGRLVSCKLFFDGLIGCFEIIGIHNAHAPNPHGTAERFQINFGGRIALDVVPGRRVLLMSGHAGDGVVQNDHRGCGVVVHNICKTGHAGMHKRGVTDDTDGFVLILRSARLVEAMHARARSAHADIEIHGIERQLFFLSV